MIVDSEKLLFDFDALAFERLEKHGGFFNDPYSHIG
jgi:hypothetical protein